MEAAVEKVEENPYTPAAGESKVEEPAAEVAAEVAVEVASETVAEEKPAEGESF